MSNILNGEHPTRLLIVEHLVEHNIVVVKLDLHRKSEHKAWGRMGYYSSINVVLLKYVLTV